MDRKILDEVETAATSARRDLRAAERLRDRIGTAIQHVSEAGIPDVDKGVQVTVSIDWLNWMIDFFESGAHADPDDDPDERF